MGEYVDVVGFEYVDKIGEHPNMPPTYTNIHKVWVDYEPNDTEEMLQIKAKALYYKFLRNEISSLDKNRLHYR
jgi:hypothetical protein